MKSKGVVVVTDRLGSVRANSNGEFMSYYPYGEERTSTADNREKFGTYTRDSTTQDYADQRYYAVGMGRFNSADPSKGSGCAIQAVGTSMRTSGRSDQWKVLSHEGIKVQNILDHYNDENFYDVRDGSQFANQTQANIGIAGSDQTTLSASLGGSDAVTVGTLGSASTTAVLLGKQYFFTGNTDANRQNSLLHEMLHALGEGTDTGILTNKYFLQNGLVNKSVGNFLDTSGISDWLSRDCKK